MSVPRPAMLVEIVIIPLWPAKATIFASFALFLAFNNWNGKPLFFKK
jgi:hypothetical protein